ncbi:MULTISPECIES: TDP-N-acetylfucosamine:lipid II N-acetylfucosaminyltransferase [Flavobacterium]|uniref:TDP-N-acetylfucosamine:lipid II N-acetylfucosaminyltransferase n=1 Tax=Flavobacterium jumunjinense TaxID=998845 RepID=A0ABV5GJ50_9FLAO|nr:MULTISPECIES: TDP-N-acetylfucosamine:lipid II N-acetylfucosaminyltransferase [Flavobacterium]
MFTKKIIHIFNDDKFIDPAITLFEAVIPNVSEYFILKSKKDAFQFITSPLVKRLDFEDEVEMAQFYKTIDSNTNRVLFLHALDKIKQEIVLNTSSEIIKVWFIWGFDLYSNWKLLRKNIYESKTKKYLQIKRSLKEKIIFNDLSFFVFKNKTFFKKILPSKVITILENRFATPYYKAIHLIDVVVPVIPDEFLLVKNIGIHPKFAPFTYGCIEDLLKEKINESVLGRPNILIGNSADPSNNHLEIFIKLSKLDLGERKIYVPLSYSGNAAYKEFVLEQGKIILGNNFVPLLDFMTLAAYNEILLSCGTLIFNHVRQQGVGNIISMGYLGAKLFLNKKSPVYSFYKKEGMCIHSIDDLNNASLQVEAIQKNEVNRSILFNLYSREKVHFKIKELIKVINSIDKRDA